jgi:hypothetical protein
MANTPQIAPRVPRELIEAARDGVGEPDASISVLVRAGLAVLAGMTVAEALSSARARPGPKPRALGGAG